MKDKPGCVVIVQDKNPGRYITTQAAINHVSKTTENNIPSTYIWILDKKPQNETLIHDYKKMLFHIPILFGDELFSLKYPKSFYGRLEDSRLREWNYGALNKALEKSQAKVPTIEELLGI